MPLIVRAPVPYRLDLTAAVLRRLSTNAVDLLTADARYVRAIPGGRSPLVLDVRTVPEGLAVRVTGGDEETAAALVRRILGLDADVAGFERAAAQVPWLAPLVARMRGVRPPRYPSLWEALVNAVVFQQVSIHAAGAILRRVVEHTSPPVLYEGLSLRAFPTPARILEVDAQTLRALGLSRNKVASLHGLAEAIAGGGLDAGALEDLPTPELLATLASYPGVGPWTAAVVALRGFGRLDLFPMNDSGAARSFALISGRADLDVHALLRALGEQRGMLYYYLLLGRLEQRGELPPTGPQPVPGRPES